jgi:hypothetical protein
MFFLKNEHRSLYVNEDEWVGTKIFVRGHCIVPTEECRAELAALAPMHVASLLAALRTGARAGCVCRYCGSTAAEVTRWPDMLCMPRHRVVRVLLESTADTLRHE